MCEAWDGAMMMYREEALAEGLQTGNYQRQKQVARNMYLRGFSVKDTMGIVEAEENQVLKWFQEFQTESNSNPEI